MADRADEEVDLLARSPRLRGAQAEPLVEDAHSVDDASAKEDRERDRAVPEVVVGQSRRVVLPGASGAPGRVGGSTRESVECLVVREPLGDALEQSGRVDAVVVGKRDDVRAHVLERDVPRARQPGLRSQVNELQWPPDEEIVGAQVVVLVDDDNPQGRVVLSLQRVEEATELVRSSDRRDDEVERRKLPRHGP